MKRRDLLRGAGLVAGVAAAAPATLQFRAFDPEGAPAGPNFLNSLLLTDSSEGMHLTPHDPDSSCCRRWKGRAS